MEVTIDGKVTINGKFCAPGPGAIEHTTSKFSSFEVPLLSWFQLLQLTFCRGCATWRWTWRDTEVLPACLWCDPASVAMPCQCTSSGSIPRTYKQNIL